MRGSLVLAGVLVGAWMVVFAVTQVVVEPPLGAAGTVAAGVGLTVLIVLGYPSALRGPRSSRPSVASGTQSSERETMRPNRTIAFAGRSLPLRSGLTEDAAQRTAELLRPLLTGDAVAITDRERVLAFVGPGADHHEVGERPQTKVTTRVLAKGRSVVVRRQAHLGCPNPDCPLRSAVVAPLRIGKRIAGTLKVYRVDAVPPSRELVEGLAGILSLHLELSEHDRERKLAVDAKLDALRAQINPHFLFNILNTIGSKARTDPEEARQLLLRLSDFFRYAVRQDGHFAEFGQEYFFVRTYLSLEQARYGDRLRIRYDIEPQVLTAHVPVLTIQPLVENAVKHGLANKVEGGTVTVKARVDPLRRITSIQVSDDGVGISADELDRIRNGETDDGAGLGLRNISGRLETLFGERYRFDIQSTEGSGTVVDLSIPLR